MKYTRRKSLHSSRIYQKAILILFFLLSIASKQLVFCQINCHLKLIDAYSFEPIQINSSLKIKNADFTIDTVNNIITLYKIKRKNLEISLNEYDKHSEKIKLRKFKGDTIVRQLTPNKSVLEDRFQQKWKSTSHSSDTLIFENTDEVKRHISSYLNYLLHHLMANDKMCDNGLCSYSNTYRYHMRFSIKNSTFKLNTIKKLQPMDYECAELDVYLEQLIDIYPNFRILRMKEDKGDLSIRFYISMY